MHDDISFDRAEGFNLIDMDFPRSWCTRLKLNKNRHVMRADLPQYVGVPLKDHLSSAVHSFSHQAVCCALLISLQVVTSHAMHLALGSVEEQAYLSKMHEPYSPRLGFSIRL